MGSDPEIEKKLGSFCFPVHETKTSLSWEESTEPGRLAGGGRRPGRFYCHPEERQQQLPPWPGHGVSPREEGGLISFCSLCCLSPAGGTAGQQLEARLAAGEGKEPPGAAEWGGDLPGSQAQPQPALMSKSLSLPGTLSSACRGEADQ